MRKKTERQYIELAFDKEGEGFTGTLIKRGDTRNYGDFKQQVAKDAKITVADDAILNRHHLQHLPIASSATDDLDVDHGQDRVQVTLNRWPEHSTAQEAKSMLEAGLLSGLSMEYRVNEASWEGDDLRVIKDVEIIDMAMVHRPAFPESRINREVMMAQDGYEHQPERRDIRTL